MAEKKDYNKYVVTKVDLPATLEAIPVGTGADFTCQVLGNYIKVYFAVARQNKRLGYEKYHFESSDNGATYRITNNGERR